MASETKTTDSQKSERKKKMQRTIRDITFEYPDVWTIARKFKNR